MVIAPRILVVMFLLAVLSVSCASTGNQPDTKACWQEAEPTALKPDADSEIVAPKPVYQAQPVIPRAVRRDATATIEAVIGEDGTPRHVCVVSGDPGWGRVVADAFRQWRFTPATRDGKPVAVVFSMTSVFNLKGR